MNSISCNKVAVLLAAYNGEKYITQQLETILSQKDVVIDIYISLDQSTDSTKSIIEKFQRIHGNIFLLPVGERFGTSGRNFFRLIFDVDFSNYKYICFSDQDDIWLDEKLSRAIHYLSETKSDAYSGNITAFWPDGTEKLITKNYSQRKYDYLFESAGPGCTFVLSEALASEIKEYLIEHKNKLATLWLHDWFIYAYARSRAYKWFIDSKPMMLYRQHDNNVVGANAGFFAFLDRSKEVINGSAYKRVVDQAVYLGLDSLPPIELIKKQDSLSFLKLSLTASQCRRRPVDQFLFFISSLICSLKEVA